MRRVVTAMALVLAALMLAACASGGAAEPGTPTTPSSPTAPTTPGSVSSTNTDILSPTVVVAPGEMFPTDDGSVPAAVLANIQAKKPMLVYYYDPTTKVAADQRKEIDKALKGYTGEIALVTFDYTIGLGSGATAASTAPAAEVEKAALLAGILKVNTTPYIVIVDGAGRITYKAAGFVDRGLLEREILRATE